MSAENVRMSDEKRQMPKEELISIVSSFKQQQRATRKRSKILIAIPLIASIILFSFISQAAAYYQRETETLQVELGETKRRANQYRERLGMLDQSPDEAMKALSNYQNDRDRISSELNIASGEAQRLRNEIAEANTRLKSSLDKATGLYNAIKQAEDQHTERIKRLYYWLRRDVEQKAEANLSAYLRDVIGTLSSSEEGHMMRLPVPPAPPTILPGKLAQDYQNLLGAINEASGHQATINSKSGLLSQKLKDIGDKQAALADVNQKVYILCQGQMVKKQAAK